MKNICQRFRDEIKPWDGNSCQQHSPPVSARARCIGKDGKVHIVYSPLFPRKGEQRKDWDGCRDYGHDGWMDDAGTGGDGSNHTNHTYLRRHADNSILELLASDARSAAVWSDRQPFNRTCCVSKSASERPS